MIAEMAKCFFIKQIRKINRKHMARVDLDKKSLVSAYKVTGPSLDLL